MSNQIRYSNASDTPYITGSDLSEKYYLQQFHFHWGFNIFQGKILRLIDLIVSKELFKNLKYNLGSEHHMDEKKFPGEVNLYLT